MVDIESIDCPHIVATRVQTIDCTIYDGLSYLTSVARFGLR